MSEGRTAAGAAHRVGSGTTRLVRAWRALPHESRLAAFASIGLFLTLFLPWYQVTLIAPARSATLQSASATITGWGAFSFVEAAVLLVAAGVLTLLFQRAEGRAFHLPGGDGGVLTAAGAWTCLLIVWRIFDKQGATTHGPSATTSGVEWGIFVALAAGAFLAYSGSRIRAAHRPEPPLPGESEAPVGSSAAATVVLPPRAERRPGRQPEDRSSRRPDDRSDRRPEDRSDRRPARTPPPVSADPAAPPAPDSPPADRPRRRATAAELFERVVPEDPPTMPFGRAKPADVEPTVRRAKPPADEQLTMRLGEDDTLVRGEDETLVRGEDETLVRGEDETLVLGEDATLPLAPRPKRH